MNLTYEIIYKKEFLRDDEETQEFRLVRVCEEDKIGSDYSVYPSTRRIDGIWQLPYLDTCCYYHINYGVPDSYSLEIIKAFNDRYVVGDPFYPYDEFFLDVACEFEGILNNGEIF